MEKCDEELNQMQNNLLKEKEKSKSKLPLLIALILIFLIALAGFLLYFLDKRKEKEEEDERRKEMQENGHYTFSLNNWEGESSEKIKSSPEIISSITCQEKFLKAPENWTTVTAMGLLVGDSNDIFFETKLNQTDKTQFDKPWWFRSKFSIPDLNDTNQVILHINGINYKADIYVDSRLVADQKQVIGTFIKHTFDITNIINRTQVEHAIALLIHRPHNQWGNATEYPKELDLAISYVDWNPEAPDSNMGVWQPVDIEVIQNKAVFIENFFVTTKVDTNRNVSSLSLRLQLRSFLDKDTYVKGFFKVGNLFECEFKGLEVEKESNKVFDIDEKICKKELEIDNKYLWYPYNMGEPHLVELIINITSPYRYSIKKQIGLKQVTSVLSPDGKKRLYKINGKDVLLKGAGWTPDIFLRMTPELYEKHIKYVKDLGLNTIRSEGKFEHDEFYSLCDHYGIMVISGFNCGDAWQKWELWTDEIKRIARDSLRSLLRRLARHVSSIIFIQGSDYNPPENIEKDWNIIFKEEKWPNENLTSATDKVSTISGKTGVKMTGPYSWVPPHYFLFDSKEEKGGAWGFLTEGGPGENPLREGSLELVFRKENIKWPLNATVWDYHCGNDVSKFRNLSHFLPPVEERYGKIVSFEDFQRKSAATVYDSHKAFFEAYAINRYTATGYIQWMLNNAWPSNIWHLYDYFFNPTPAYFACKKANEKLHVYYNYKSDSIYISNNYLEDIKHYELKLSYSFISGQDGEVLATKISEYSLDIDPDKIRELTQKLNTKEIYDKYDVNVVILHIIAVIGPYNGIKQKIGNSYILAKNMDEMDYANSTFYNVGIKKYADLKVLQGWNYTTITPELLYYDKEKGQMIYRLTNTGNTFALLVELRLVRKDDKMIVPIFWSDNYFSIPESDSYEVTIDFDKKDLEGNDEVKLIIKGWNVKREVHSYK